MPALTRRALPGLAGLAGLTLATAACDPRHPFSSDPAPTSGPTKDDLLVAQVVDAVRQQQWVADYVPNPDLVALHTAHLIALGVPAAAASAVPTPGASASLAVDLRTSEAQLKETLTTAAGAAESGSLARVLASMAAAVAQQVVVLS